MCTITCSGYLPSQVPTRAARNQTRPTLHAGTQKHVLKQFLMTSILLLFVCSSVAQGDDATLLTDEFDGLRSGMFSRVLGAHTEYHHIPEATPKGNWAISCFGTGTGPQRAWRVMSDDGKKVMYQSYDNKRAHTHPMVIAGDDLWRDYTVSVTFAPESERAQSGLVFRYRNDRCYYFFGVHGNRAVLKMVRHGIAFRKPFEKILAEAPCQWRVGEYLVAKVTVCGDRIRAELGNSVVVSAEDPAFSQGKIGLMADVPTRYREVLITAGAEEKQAYLERKAKRKQELLKLQAANPRPVVWKKIKTEGFGVGRNLRFGDLDGDGQTDLLIGQVVHHLPNYSEVSCMTAMTFDGKQLWQVGEPDRWKDHLTNDVGFQIHDLDGDGRNEVVYCMNFEIVVADGATGKTKYKAPTPKTDLPKARYPRILGDSLFFCDTRGTGHPRDIVIKDRYRRFWVLNDRLELIWKAACNTGHYPFAYDVDNDGKDELAMGYSLFDDDGTRLWSLDEKLGDHADGVAIVRFREDLQPVLFNSASDEGIFFTDVRGNVLKHHYLGHVQNPAVANFRDDLPGLELVSINFWGNQGIIHFYDAEGNVYHDCEPNQYGSMCLPINWTGRGEEYFVHSANVDEGGMFDGHGRRVVLFPDDAHPDMCNAVLDLTGDCRDEVVVWDPYELWVYTQEDNPKSGKLYKPARNPMYNYSNYQATVSLPGWSE